MNTRKTSDIFDYLNNQDIPPILNISFCLRLMGVKMNDLYKSAGVSRSFLYQVLAGKRKPNDAIKRELSELGINPWEDKNKYNKSLELTGNDCTLTYKPEQSIVRAP